MTTIDEAIALGRRLREGSVSKEAAMKTGDFQEGSLEKAALELLANPEVPARDDAESLLVLMGALGFDERRVAKRAAELDASVPREQREAFATTDPWLRRIARLDASPWWLDLVSLAVLREVAKAFDPARPFRDGPRAAPMKLRSRPASVQLHAEVVGMEDDPARLALERGAIVARLFDGEVEVFGLGLRPDQEDVPTGFCVARKGGGVEGITAVTIGGEAAGQGKSGWWAPLPAKPGAVALLVRVGDGEESVDLDLT
jgi:hypothetical protein